MSWPRSTVNYPNPFRLSTTIRFNLERSAAVNLAVYDMSGKLDRHDLISGWQVILFALLPQFGESGAYCSSKIRHNIQEEAKQDMAIRKKSWRSGLTKQSKPKVPSHVKQAVTRRSEELIEAVLKPKNLEEPPNDPHINYLIDITSKWYRNYFYFCATYKNPRPGAIDSTFEVKFSRMEYQPNGQYTLSYMRHTGQWWELFSDITLEEAFKYISEEPHFLP